MTTTKIVSALIERAGELNQDLRNLIKPGTDMTVHNPLFDRRSKSLSWIKKQLSKDQNNAITRRN